MIDSLLKHLGIDHDVNPYLIQADARVTVHKRLHSDPLAEYEHEHDE